MNLTSIKFRSDLHKYCILCMWIRKGHELSRENIIIYTELDEQWQHHRLSKHPAWQEIMKDIDKEFVYAHNKVLIREFDVPERHEIEKEAFTELLKNCSLITR